MIGKIYEFTLDLKEENSLALKGIVSGDMGNQFNITVTDNETPVDLTDARIRLVITNKDGHGAQDSLIDDPNFGYSGFDLADVASGKVSIFVFNTMISNGLNTGVLEIYTDDGQYLATTQEFTFTATNSPSEKAYEYPSLIWAERYMMDMMTQVQQWIEMTDPDNIMHYNDSMRTLALLETDGDGTVVATRRLIVTDQDPASLSDLQEGDIILSSYGT